MPTLQPVQAMVQRGKHIQTSLGNSSTNLERNEGFKEQKAFSKADRPEWGCTEGDWAQRVH
jgi:hypothetical protein